jgi:hypothetical protein
MRRSSYMKRAANRFLAGTRIKSPVEAVEAGLRSLEEWARLLSEEREIENQYLQARQVRRSRPRQTSTSGGSGRSEVQVHALQLAPLMATQDLVNVEPGLFGANRPSFSTE